MTAVLLATRPAIGLVVAVGLPVLALSVLPLLPRATRRADEQREKAGRATELASDTVAGLRVLRGIGGEELFLDRYRQASQEVRTAVGAQRPDVGADRGGPGRCCRDCSWSAWSWYGAPAGAATAEISVGELVTVYGAVAFLLMPLRNFEEIAMAWSFSRPVGASGPRGCWRWSGPPTPQRSGRRGAVLPDGDLYDPVSGLLAPRRAADRRGVRRPGRGGTAGRPARRAQPDGRTGRAGRVGDCSAACRWTVLPLAAARSAVLVQDKDPVLLSGTLRELLDVPSSGRVAAAVALEAAQCADVLAALAQASVDADGDPMRTRDHRTRPVPVRRPAPAARAGPVAGDRPGGAGAGRADLGGRLAHRGADRGRDCGGCGTGAPRWCSPPVPLLLDRADRVVLRARTAPSPTRAPTANCCAPAPATARWSPGRPDDRPPVTDEDLMRGDGMIGVTPPAYDPAAPRLATTLPVGSPATVRAYVRDADRAGTAGPSPC